MFALQLCLAAGIKPIITSSSDEKLDYVKKIDPKIQGINYKTADVQAEVLRLTEGKGVDIVINNAGFASIPADLQLLRKKRGIVSLVGFLEGINASWDPSVLFSLVLKAARLQYVLLLPTLCHILLKKRKRGHADIRL